jgi:hypothetical protein
MTKLAASVALFLMPALFFCSFMEITLRHIPNDYSYKNQFMEANAGTLRILVLGSSHSLQGIDPQYFDEPAFNLASMSQTLKYDHFLFSKYSDKLTGLRYLLVPVSYFSLVGQLEDGNENYRIKNYSIYYHCQYHLLSVKYNTEIFNGDAKSNIVRLMKYLLYDANHLSCNKYGFSSAYSDAARSDLDETGKAAALRHTAEAPYSYLRENTGYLEDMITACGAKKARVILLTLPALSYYTSRLDKKQLDLTTRTCEKLQEKFDHVRYFSYLNDPGFTKEDFRDADHLNGRGAKKFTLILRKLLQEKNP